MTKLESTDRTKFAHVVLGGTSLYAQNQVGRHEGYATLDEAIADVQPLSTDESGHASSVVYQGDDGRYYARSILAKRGMEQRDYHRGSQYDDTDNLVSDAPFAAIVDGYTVTKTATATVGGRVWMPPVHAVRELDRPLHAYVPPNMTPYPTATGVLGSKQGYASLDDAVAAMRMLTGPAGGAQGSAVIYRDGAKYFARELMIDTGPPKHSSPTKYLEPFDVSQADKRVVFDNATVEAVVKGDHVTYGWQK
jgi:hypothetical protein